MTAIEQPTLWDPPTVARKRGVFAATSRESEPPEDTKASQRRRILHALATGPLTYHEIAERTGIALSVVCWRMRELDMRGDGSVCFATAPDGSLLKSHHRRLVQLVPTKTLNRRAG